jgi:hypothetical protein
MAVRRAFQAVKEHHERRIGLNAIDEIDVDEILAAGRVPAFTPEHDLGLLDADGRVDRLQVAAGQPQRRAIAGHVLEQLAAIGAVAAHGQGSD